MYFKLNIYVFVPQYSYNRRGKCDIRINITFNSIQHLESTVFRQIHFDTIVMNQCFTRGNFFDYIIYIQHYLYTHTTMYWNFIYSYN